MQDHIQNRENAWLNRQDYYIEGKNTYANPFLTRYATDSCESSMSNW